MSGIGAAFGLGFIYFVGAVPGGVLAGAPAWLAGLAAWAGYTAGAAAVLLPGARVRAWLAGKLGARRKPSSLVAKAWSKFGLAGLGLLAPVTIGPQIGGLFALAAGEPAFKILAALSLGVVPWCAGFSFVAAIGAEVAG
jgi:hypothetical protein